MPRPVYILCSESGSEDKRTGLFSHFRVIEGVEVEKKQHPREGNVVFVPALRFQAVAIWERDETDDPQQEYEWRFVLYLPPNADRLVAAQGKFLFTARRFRSMIEAGDSLFRGSGQFRVESQIRPVGSSEDAWLSQCYSFPIEEKTESPAVGESD